MSDSLLLTIEAFDPSLFWEYRNVLFPGLLYNFYIFFLTIGFAIVLGLLVAIFRLNTSIFIRGIGTVFLELCRNTPEYIMLIWVFYVPPLLLSHLFNENISFTPLVACVIAFSLTSSAYFTESFRAGILSVSKGHIDAARSFGMSWYLTLFRIILPQAMRYMLPEFMNQCVSLFKLTALVSLVTVPDLLYQVSMVSQDVGKSMPLYTYAAIVYFILIYALASLAERISEPWRQKSK